MGVDSRQLMAKLRRVANNSRKLDSLKRDAADIVAERAGQEAPFESGKLADSIESTTDGGETLIHVGEDYGAFVHLDDPYLQRAAKKSKPAIASMAAANLENLLDR